MSNDDKISAGFAVGLYGEDVIESNIEGIFSPRYGNASPSDRARAIREGYIEASGALTPKGWEQLTEDCIRVESNVVAWLRKNFEDARDEGHGSGGDLIGAFWVKPSSKKQMSLLEDMVSDEGLELESLDASIWKGTSKLSNAIGGRLHAFDVDKPTTFAERARARR